MTLVTDNTPRTEWFPAEVKPVRVGRYECCYGEMDRAPWIKLRWDGENWRAQHGGIAMFGDPLFIKFDCSWRGLAEDPNA